MKKTFVGDFIDAPCLGSSETVRIRQNHCVIVDNDGVIINIEPFDVSKSYDNVCKLDAGQFYIPGFIDIHCHAPQFPNRGLGTDVDLLKWLEKYTFPEESDMPTWHTQRGSTRR